MEPNMKSEEPKGKRPGAREPRFTHRKFANHREVTEHITDAPGNLGSANSDSRKAAAEHLGKQGTRTDYESLLDALEREQDRETKLAILKALYEIGGREIENGVLSRGLERLARFMEKNLPDGEVIESAVQAFRWTGTLSAMVEVLDSIEEMAKGKYPESENAVRGLVLEFYTGD